ncbi:hypothetical protein HYT45_01345 [Candidatus Uhrbacteria bacterium]|nr:hypothetical protein [Candidatus Uhrbacteria bacterium]
MNKFFLVLGALILFGGGCALAPQARRESPPVAAESKTGNEVMVEMTANGFNPPAFDIQVGTTVKFVNKDTVAHWPASGVHPTHQLCPGFDALKPIPPGESYSFTFTVAKTCPMHDHLNPGTRGSITIGE